MAEEIEDAKMSQFQGETVEKTQTKLNDEKEIIEYKKGEVLGRGGFGICYKCINVKTKEIFVLKETEIKQNITNQKSDESQTNYYEERETHCTLNHKNIVQFIDSFEYNGKFYLLLEFCENKDLSSLLKKRITLKEIEVIYYITNLIKAVKYLHEKRLVHRDIKPQNIFLTDKLEVKLGDFGLAKAILNEKIHKGGGTLYYMAPEILEGNGYSFEIDIWAIGIIIYQLILGELPFYDVDKDKEKIKPKIMKGEFKFPENAIISNAAKDLIKQILVKDPSKRPTLNQILRHEFFKLGRSIPKLIPVSFKDKEPSINYIKNFMPDADDNGIVNHDGEIFTILIDLKLNEDLVRETNVENNYVYVRECINNHNYIKRYGLAYRLSNNNIGVCFKDSTQLIICKETNNAVYIERGYEPVFFNKNDEKRIASDRNLEKKMKLLNYYLTYKNKSGPGSDTSSTNNQGGNINEHDISSSKGLPVYVKQYFITDNISILLKLNNKNVQVYFVNGDNILFTKQSKEVISYKKNQNELQGNIYSLDNISDIQNNDLQNKLQYAKNLFEKIIPNKE